MGGGGVGRHSLSAELPKHYRTPSDMSSWKMQSIFTGIFVISTIDSLSPHHFSWFISLIQFLQWLHQPIMFCRWFDYRIPEMIWVWIDKWDLYIAHKYSSLSTSRVDSNIRSGTRSKCQIIIFLSVYFIFFFFSQWKSSHLTTSILTWTSKGMID